MKTKLAVLIIGLLVTYPASGDIVKIETNTWTDKKELVWTGILQKIDGATGIAYFTYNNRDKVDTFEVHVTRIYSLTIDEQSRVDRAFPQTQQKLSDALPTNPRPKRELELSNKNFVATEIPDDVQVRPDRKSLIIYLSGQIKTADLEKIMLEAKAQKEPRKQFTVDRSALLKWIR
ncbi:MAG: hypothetical protein HY526_10655 [Betaproteobacteria bacterium]|nr:hypothetical protein [Betaproteobacteria bacterium]